MSKAFPHIARFARPLPGPATGPDVPQLSSTALALASSCLGCATGEREADPAGTSDRLTRWRGREALAQEG